MASIEIGAGEVAHIAPPLWWREQKREVKGFRLSGGLFRPPLLGEEQEQGTDIGYWSSLHRTIAGLESALGYGRAGRISQWLRPAVGKGGAGQHVAIPWYVLLALSGEYIPMPAGGETPSQASHPAGYKRFQRRVGSLKDAGYLASGRREAEAGDTVELVGVKRGSRWEPAGIIVRASAAYVAGVKAAQNPKNWTVIPADQVLGDPQIPDDERPS